MAYIDERLDSAYEGLCDLATLLSVARQLGSRDVDEATGDLAASVMEDIRLAWASFSDEILAQLANADTVEKLWGVYNRVEQLSDYA